MQCKHIYAFVCSIDTEFESSIIHLAWGFQRAEFYALLMTDMGRIGYETFSSPRRHIIKFWIDLLREGSFFSLLHL